MITLREMKPDDGAAFAELHANSPDGGAVRVSAHYQIDAIAHYKTLKPNLIGVVAEHPDHAGIVGAGMVSFIDAQWDGVVRKTALLSALMVHPAVRRQGLAGKLAARRIERAREVIGDDGVIYAMIQGGNVGSVANARKWATQFITGPMIAPVKVRRNPPKALPQYTVRAAEPDDYEQIAAGANAFYADYNGYIPLTADKIASKIAVTPFDTPVHGWQVVADRSGKLVAGMGVTDLRRTTLIQIVHVPPPIRLANLFLRLIPPDGILRLVHARDVWHAPGHEAAAPYVWQMARYEWRDRATAVRYDFDARGPIKKLLDLPGFPPQSPGTIALHAPVPVDGDRIIAPYF